jgi:hypothetical protein
MTSRSPGQSALVPCAICSKPTPIETICSRPAPDRTLCPAHRKTANELLAAHVDAFLAECRANAAHAGQERAA